MTTDVAEEPVQLPPPGNLIVEKSCLENNTVPETAASIAPTMNGRAPIDLADHGSWALIESDPAVFTTLLNDLGVENAQVEELYTLDAFDTPRIEQGDALYPLGLIFAFMMHDDAEEEQDGDPASNPESPSNAEQNQPGLYYARQMISNACATQALLSICLNWEESENAEPDSVRVSMGEQLKEFRMKTLNLDPAERGHEIGRSQLFKRVHNSFAHEDNQMHADYQEEFMAKERKRSTKSKITKEVELVEDDNFHFISYVPCRGQVYEMDGLSENGAKLLGSYVKMEDWWQVAKPAILNRIEKYSSSEIRFNLLAVVPDRLSRLKNALQNSEDSKKEEIEKLIREESEQRLNDENENKRRKTQYLNFIQEFTRHLILYEQSQNPELEPEVVTKKPKESVKNPRAPAKPKTKAQEDGAGKSATEVARKRKRGEPAVSADSLSATAEAAQTSTAEPRKRPAPKKSKKDTPSSLPATEVPEKPKAKRGGYRVRAPVPATNPPDLAPSTESTASNEPVPATEIAPTTEIVPTTETADKSSTKAKSRNAKRKAPSRDETENAVEEKAPKRAARAPAKKATTAKTETPASSLKSSRRTSRSSLSKSQEEIAVETVERASTTRQKRPARQGKTKVEPVRELKQQVQPEPVEPITTTATGRPIRQSRRSSQETKQSTAESQSVAPASSRPPAKQKQRRETVSQQSSAPVETSEQAAVNERPARGRGKAGAKKTESKAKTNAKVAAPSKPEESSEPSSAVSSRRASRSAAAKTTAPASPTTTTTAKRPAKSKKAPAPKKKAATTKTKTPKKTASKKGTTATTPPPATLEGMDMDGTPPVLSISEAIKMRGRRAAATAAARSIMQTASPSPEPEPKKATSQKKKAVRS